MWRKVMLVLLMTLVCAGAAWPHSTAGLMKVTLEERSPGIDDVAYYIERWVGKRLDEEGRSGRFAVMDFTGIQHTGDQIIVQMQIFDQKTGRMAPATLILERGPRNTWKHLNEHGATITEAIYTYTKPGLPVWQLLVACLIAACLAQLAVMLWRRFVRKGQTGGGD